MDPTVIAAAIVTVLVAFTSSLLLVIAAVAKAKKELLDSNKEIYSKVDGTASELRAEVQALHQQVGALQEKRVDEAKAQIAPTVVASLPSSPTTVLTEIEKNTKEIAQNTGSGNQA